MTDSCSDTTQNALLRIRDCLFCDLVPLARVPAQHCHDSGSIHAWGAQGYIFINTTCPTFQQDSSLRFSQTVRNYGCNPNDYSSSGYHVSKVQVPACLVRLHTEAVTAGMLFMSLLAELPDEHTEKFCVPEERSQ